jgi:hypothetical protein
MRKFKYSAKFSSIAKCATDKDQDRYLAVASLSAVRSLLPKNIDYEKNYDLLGFAGNGAVINRANKNHHVIDSKTAVAVNKYFAYKPMDLEHNRASIVGVILNTGFTTYGSNQIMTEEEALACLDPFNIAIGGLVFRIVNTDFAELLEQSSNPESLLHEAVSLSWEVGYNDFWINVGSPNLSEAETVKEPNKIEELSKFLRMNGGENQLEDGTPIYQYIYGEDVMPLAYGFTTRPAAQVKGIVTANEQEDKKVKNSEKTQEIISHTNKSIVTPNATMKNLTTLEEIYALTDADKDNVSLANLGSVIKEAIKTADEKWRTEKAAKEDAVATVKELQTSVTKISEKMDAMAASQIKAEAEATFNSRMSLVDSEFELTDADRKAIASDISALTDEASFEGWYGKFSVYAAAKKKAAKPAKPDNDADDDTDDDDTSDTSKAAKSKADDMGDDDAAASDDKKKKKKDSKAEIAAAVEEALKNANAKGTVINAGVTTGSSLVEQYKSIAFNKDGIVLKK